MHFLQQKKYNKISNLKSIDQIAAISYSDPISSASEKEQAAWEKRKCTEFLSDISKTERQICVYKKDEQADGHK